MKTAGVFKRIRDSFAVLPAALLALCAPVDNNPKDPGPGFTPNPVAIVASRDSCAAFSGTADVKIVFVNVTGTYRTLCYVDFNAPAPVVREYTDDPYVCSPVLSPDGRFVAYCSGNDGQSGPSTITIRSVASLNSPRRRLPDDTAYIPRWWVNRKTGDTSLVYASSAAFNENAPWKSTTTLMRKVNAGAPAGSAGVLTTDGSFHGGLSADSQYLVTGYSRLLVRNLLNNDERQLFLSPSNGKDTSGSCQVCNVSLSPDTGSALRVLFLDFGYPRINTITGTSYGVHQYLFITMLHDSIVGFLHCPAGEWSWDFPEWSNQPGFAVACARNGADQAHAIYAVDLESGRVLRLFTGEVLEHPYLWFLQNRNKT